MGLDRCRFKKSELLPRLLCCVCDEVLHSPVQCSLCRKFLCKGCVGRCESSACLHQEIVPVSKYLTMKLDDLELRCRFFSHGCGFSSRLKDIPRHESSCQFSCPSDCKENLSHSSKEKLQCSDCKTKMVLCRKGCGKLMTVSEGAKHDCFAELLAETQKKAGMNATMVAKLDASMQEKARTVALIADLSEGAVGEVRACERRLEEIELEKRRVRETYEDRVDAAQKQCEEQAGGYIRGQVDLLTQLGPDTDANVSCLQSKLEELFAVLSKRQREELRVCTTKTTADTFSFTDSKPKPPKFVAQFRPKPLLSTAARTRSQSCAKPK